MLQLLFIMRKFKISQLRITLGISYRSFTQQHWRILLHDLLCCVPSDMYIVPLKFLCRIDYRKIIDTDNHRTKIKYICDCACTNTYTASIIRDHYHQPESSHKASPSDEYRNGNGIRSQHGLSDCRRHGCTVQSECAPIVAPSEVLGHGEESNPDASRRPMEERSYEVKAVRLFNQ